jgi:hypothetical protein
LKHMLLSVSAVNRQDMEPNFCKSRQ